MDALEDSWWPSSVTALRPFTLPSSSQWLQRETGELLIIQAGGDPAEYRVHRDCLPFLMLLDIVQLTYLMMSTSNEFNHQETFYKGVMFLDSLRREFLSAIPKAPRDQDSCRAFIPESMRRWLCRFIHGIPHDPENRRRHAPTLQKAYLEVDVLKYDFLDWSLTHEEDLVKSLSSLSSLEDMTSAYPVEPLRWLKIIRSQFVQVGLFTPLSRDRMVSSEGSGEEIIDMSIDPINVGSLVSFEGSGEEIIDVSIDPINMGSMVSSKCSEEEEMVDVLTDPINMDSFNLVTAPSPQGASGSSLGNALNEAVLEPSIEKESILPRLATSPLFRGRGRPRRQKADIPQETPEIEPMRKLRIRKNANVASEENPWDNLSKAPLLTPLSPKKPCQIKAPQRASRLPGSMSGKKTRLMKNQQMAKTTNVAESDEWVPRLNEKPVVSTGESLQTQPMVRKVKVGHLTESLQTQPMVQKAKVTGQPAAKRAKIMEEQMDNPEEVISSHSEHFKYIAAMTSFEDPRFKHIAKELLNDRSKSWKAFKALSPTWQKESATNWETLKKGFDLTSSIHPFNKAQAIRSLDRIFIDYKKFSYL